MTSYLYGSYTLAQNVSMLVPTVAQALGVSALPTITEAWTGGNRKNIQNSIESVVKFPRSLRFRRDLGCLPCPARSFPSFCPTAKRRGDRHAIVDGFSGYGNFYDAVRPGKQYASGGGRVDLPVKLLAVGMVNQVGDELYAGCGAGNQSPGGVLRFGRLLFVDCRTRNLRLVQAGKNKAACDRRIAETGTGRYSLRRGGQGELRSFLQAASPSVSTLLAVIVAVCVYIASLFITRTLSRADIQMLPKGEKLLRLLEKRRWIR